MLQFVASLRVFKCQLCAKNLQNKSIFSTFFRAAACLWTTGAADVAAALLRAALTAADAEQHDEQKSAEDD